MNPIKSPHELLMEEAGFAPASPGLVNSGQQMLLNQTGVVPHFAPGGKVVKGILSALEREANKAKFLEGTKVVDHNGKPITMYHHTTDFQGDAFDPALSQQKDRGYHGLGMYFGADDYLKRSAFGKHSSGNVAGKEGFEEGSQVMPVNLSIKNPKYIDASDQSLYGVPSEELKKQGYDGVIVTRDDSFKNAMGRTVPRQKVYNAVAFEPTQIKSSIGNEGTFDPTDPRLSKAEGGSINQQNMSPQDMLAALIAHNQAPQYFAKGGSSVMNALKEAKHKPIQSAFNLFNFSDVANEAYKAAQHAQHGRPVQAFESGFNAAAGIPAALPNVPMGVSLAVPLAGQQITEQTAQHMALHPEFRQQMNDMSQSPLGGALGGDAALAAQIMGNKDYEDVLRERNASEQTPEPEPQPAQQRRFSPLYHKTMVIK